MCDPVTAITVASTAIGAYGQYQQGKYQEKMGQYQAQVAKNNAITQNRMAEDAIARGERAEQEQRMKVAQIKSQQRAQFGASGVDVSSGSPLLAQADTAMLGELDALTLRSNAEREAYGYRVGASNYQSEAGMHLAQGQLDRMSGTYGAMGTILTGSGRVAESWNKRRA